MTAADPYNLERFVQAQAGDYDQALRELRNGRKESHWMWYIFPQFAGLGMSAMSRRYAIQSMAEARAYLGHPVLGPRLLGCAEALLALRDLTALEVLGSPDDMKLKSCATLFAHAAPTATVFQWLLDQYFAGEHDERTLSLIDGESGGR